MVALETPLCAFGTPAVDFDLEDGSGKRFSLGDVQGEQGTLIMFICNHCPYVRAIIARLVADTVELQKHGIGVCAIMPNDYANYKDDSPARMVEFARAQRFDFPYLVDETQEVARAYGAVCTPDFFGYDKDLGLQYRGRLDSGRLEPPPAGARRELLEAMIDIAAGKGGPQEQSSSMGCSVKWKA